jgi:hypothetical protein
MDVVDFNLCRRDKFNLFILFHNMALCYQKLTQLEECALCLETCLDHLTPEQLDLGHNSIAMRLIKLKLECKVRM